MFALWLCYDREKLFQKERRSMNYVYTQNDTLLHYYTCGNLMSRDSFLHVRRTMDCHVLILVLKGCLPITVEAGLKNRGIYLFKSRGGALRPRSR